MSYTVTMNDGRDIKVKYFDGGGAFVGEDFEGYEVHGEQVDGEFFCEHQQDIVRVIDDDTGEDYPHFGNSLFGGHPYEHEGTQFG